MEESSQTALLPTSPLVRRYHRPISLKIDFALPGMSARVQGGTAGTADGQSDEYSVAFTDEPVTDRVDLVSKLKNEHYIDIDAKITQRVDIYTTPFTLTLPLHAPVAADRPFDSPWDPLIH